MKFSINTTVNITDTPFDELYLKDAIHDVMRDAYMVQLKNLLTMIDDQFYKDAEHHLKCSEEIARQMKENIQVNKE